MCKTWISKIPENIFDVRPLTIFQTETDVLKYVPLATDHNNICFQAVR